MKRSRIACAIALLGIVGAAAAQNADSLKLEKVTITGSSIKRLADERAMPIEVFTADQIGQLGVASADQLVDLLSANVAGATNQITNNAVFGSDGDKTLGGGNFANLRGLGPTGTLVLLNGRRVSTHGMSGGSVDLNSIPMDAIARVEVLKDGASAIYGTDAVGGVINFITRTNFNGFALRGSYTTPMDSGGGQTARLSASGGFGNLSSDGFNLMGSVTVDSARILRGTDRPWATGYQPGLGMSPEATSSMHANIVNATGTALASTGTTVGNTGDPTRYTHLNLLAIQGRCEEIPGQVPMAPNAKLWDLYGYTVANSKYRCTRDYGRNYMLGAPQEAVNALLKGTLNIQDKHQLSVELVASDVKNRGEYAPVQISSGVTTSTVNGVTTSVNTHLPANSPYYLDMRALVGAAEFNPALPIAYRVNLLNDLGFRIRENDTRNLRAQAALDGTVFGFDYTMGLGYGESKSSATLINGFPNSRKLIDLLSSGQYNPFVMPGKTQTPAVIAKFEDMQMRGKIYDGKTSVLQADATVSGSLGRFMAGELQFAVGTNLRKESYEFSGSQYFLCQDFARAIELATYNNATLTLGCPGNTSSPLLERQIGAVFGELVAQPLKGLELTLQVRHDNYDDFGGTTNPKIGLKFQPNDMLLVRASANTGFRAPSPQQIKQGVVEGNNTGQFKDPVLCADAAAPKDPTQCARTGMPFRSGGNPDLKPESSRQASFGLVFAPMKNLQVYADYWQVQLEDRIRSLSISEMISNYSLFADNFVRDPATGVVRYIQAGWVNAASSTTKGLDFGASHQMNALGGRVISSLSGTKMISHKERINDAAPELEYVGKWSNTTLYLPWRLNASVTYRVPDWSLTVSGLYRDSYEDQNRGPSAQGGANYTVNEPFKRTVKSYTSFNLMGSYSGMKNTTISAGVINLFDRQPPFTWHNIDSAAGTGWDPRVADPRGRTVTVSASWKM